MIDRGSEAALRPDEVVAHTRFVRGDKNRNRVAAVARDDVRAQLAAESGVVSQY